jgi:hypothetical protein
MKRCLGQQHGHSSVQVERVPTLLKDIQHLLRPLTLGVVFDPSALDNAPRMSHHQEPVRVQAFISDSLQRARIVLSGRI